MGGVALLAWPRAQRPRHRPVNDVETCSVCGRTILGGEQTRTYLTPERERRTVCDLCRDRAERIGWVWEELAADLPPNGRRRAGLASLLRGRIARRREEEPADDEYGEAAEPVVPEPEPEPAGAEQDDAAPYDGSAADPEGNVDPI